MQSPCGRRSAVHSRCVEARPLHAAVVGEWTVLERSPRETCIPALCASFSWKGSADGFKDSWVSRGGGRGAWIGTKVGGYSLLFVLAFRYRHVQCIDDTKSVC